MVYNINFIAHIADGKFYDLSYVYNYKLHTLDNLIHLHVLV